MNDKKKPIESITVRVCAHSNNSLKKTSPMNPQTPIKIDDSGSTFKKPKKFKVVMICSSKKNKSFFTQFPNIRFTSNPQTVNEKFPNDKVPNSKLTWREYLTKRQHESTLLNAFKLYKRPAYLHLHTKFKKNFFILSAGWGLVSSEFKLPGYDITFSQSAPANTRRSSNINVPPLYNDFNQIEDNGDDILFLGSPDYIPLFISLTKDLKCRKIIFWKKKNTPQKYPLPNNTFKYEYYYTNSNTNWHYKLAQEL